MLFCLTAFLVMLISQNQSVVTGARYGLMLWYRDVLPLLLPFMILSNLFVLELRKEKLRKTYAVPVLLALGLLCGYPLGAKMAADFTREKLISRKTASALLPLCSNASPMFLSGYIGHAVLENRLSFLQILIMIYIPYLSVAGIALLMGKCQKRRRDKSPSRKNPPDFVSRTAPSADSILLASVIQITNVGICIMLCSIAFRLVCDAVSFPEGVTAVFCGLLEITQGSAHLAFSVFPEKIRIALILACTSFGGVSALLQTLQVTKKSGLSMCYYVTVKLLCGCMTGAGAYIFLKLQ